MKSQILTYSLAFSTLLSCLVSCGQKSDPTMTQLHQTDTDAKSNVQKAREQCYSSLDPAALDKDGVGKVKICTEQKSTDKTANIFKILTGDRAYKLDHLEGNKLSIAINAGVKFDDTSLSGDAQADLIKKINDECMPNLKNFWNKYNISMDITFSPYNELAANDQILSLDTSKDTTTKDKISGLRISEWPESSQFATSFTKDCQDKMKQASDKTPSQQIAIGQKCLLESNQKFCLAFNKMVGYWVGAEDLNDPTCTGVEKPVVVDPKKTAEENLGSFMSFPIIDSAVPAFTDDATTTKVPPASPATPSATSDTEAAPSDSTTGTQIAGIQVADSLESLAADYDVANLPGKTPPAPAPSPATPVDRDTTADPSYKPWLSYRVSPENLKSMFNCDPSAQVKNIAAPKFKTPKKAQKK